MTTTENVQKQLGVREMALHEHPLLECCAG
jgi:hypothetical protein